MQLFYDPEIASNISEFILNEKESHHAIKVLRHKSGDQILITNGKGELFKAGILEIIDKKCVLSGIELLEKKNKNVQIHLGAGIIKKTDRMEWLVEKAVENNCQEITPVVTQYSEKKIVKTERLQKIAIAAMKQSLSLFLPVIHDTVDFNQFILNSSADQKLLAIGSAYKNDHILNQLRKSESVNILIGPEGGLSKDEIKFCLEHGYKVVSLGKQRLRSETAALVSVILINAFYEFDFIE